MHERGASRSPQILQDILLQELRAELKRVRDRQGRMTAALSQLYQILEVANSQELEDFYITYLETGENVQTRERVVMRAVCQVLGQELFPDRGGRDG